MIITNKKMLKTVAEEMEAAIKQALAAYEEPVVEVCDEENGKITIDIYNKENYTLSMQEVDAVREATKKYTTDYEGSITALFDTIPMVYSLGIINVPTLQYTITLTK